MTTQPYTIRRGDVEFEISDIDWTIDRRWPVITCVRFEGAVMALTDAELEYLEEKIHCDNWDECHGY